MNYIFISSAFSALALSGCHVSDGKSSSRMDMPDCKKIAKEVQKFETGLNVQKNRLHKINKEYKKSGNLVEINVSGENYQLKCGAAKINLGRLNPDELTILLGE